MVPAYRSEYCISSGGGGVPRNLFFVLSTDPARRQQQCLLIMFPLNFGLIDLFCSSLQDISKFVLPLSIKDIV
jgi:hypothetical protein